MLRNAHAIRPIRAPVPFSRRDPAPLAPRRIDIVFGREGNAAACVGDGWSGPEDGYTWSVDDRSVLTIGKPATAERLPARNGGHSLRRSTRRPAQAMSVTVNGELVHTFDPLPRGKVECSVPGRLLYGRDTIEIMLDHPAAISPSAAAGQNDDRRLAVAFCRVSLICN